VIDFVLMMGQNYFDENSQIKLCNKREGFWDERAGSCNKREGSAERRFFT
jgi:hypothetical protein